MPLADVHPFASHLPVRISFGDGAIGELPRVLGEAGVRSAAVLVEAPVAEAPAVVEALAACEAAGIAITRQVKAPGEPSLAATDEFAELARSTGGEAIVGIGGGSALDLAKAARIVVSQGGSIARFVGGATPLEEPTVPLVLVPTTAGTGAEVSGASGLTDKSTGRKHVIAGPRARATYALVDPLLTGPACRADRAHGHRRPRAGDRRHDRAGRQPALAGRRPRGGAPPRARGAAGGRRRSDLDARREQALGSLLAGLAMNLSDCSADHSLGQALGSLLGLPHGLTIGLVLAETLDVSRGDCADRLERVADALGEPDDGTGDGSRAVRGIRRILREVSFPTGRDVGLRPEHWTTSRAWPSRSSRSSSRWTRTRGPRRTSGTPTRRSWRSTPADGHRPEATVAVAEHGGRRCMT